MRGNLACDSIPTAWPTVPYDARGPLTLGNLNPELEEKKNHDRSLRSYPSSWTPLANTYVRSREIEIYSRSARGSENTTPSGAFDTKPPPTAEEDDTLVQGRRNGGGLSTSGSCTCSPPRSANRVGLGLRTRHAMPSREPQPSPNRTCGICINTKPGWCQERGISSQPPRQSQVPMLDRCRHGVYQTTSWGRHSLPSEQSKARKVLVLHARLIVSTTTLPLHRLCQRTKATPSLLDLRCCLALTIQQGTLLPHCVENPSMRKRRPLHSSPRPPQPVHQQLHHATSQSHHVHLSSILCRSVRNAARYIIPQA